MSARARKPRTFYVPRNESQILDFSPGSSTPEYQIKSLLLSSAPRTKSIAAVGMGGTGKTTTLLALGRDRDIWARFPDGVWFIELGQDVTLESFTAQMRAMAKKAVGAEFAAEFTELMTDNGTRLQAVVDLVEAMQDLDWLVITDDPWEESGEVYSLFKQFSTEVQSPDVAFKILTSTRNKRIARRPLFDQCVDVNPRAFDGLIAKRILCEFSSTDLSVLDELKLENRGALHHILVKCAGLPLALAVAGGAVYSLMGDIENSTQTENSWKEYWRLLRQDLGVIRQPGSNHHEDGLFSSVASSLRILQTKWPADLTLSTEEVFRSFSVLTKQASIPVYSLRLMWGIRTTTAEKLVQLFADLNLVSRISTDHGVVVRLHDLLHDFSTRLTAENNELSRWHKALVDAYAGELSRGPTDSQGEGVHPRPWWGGTDTLSNHPYFMDNLVRHLLGSGNIDEAIALLVDYRWIQTTNEDVARFAFQKMISDYQLLHFHISRMDVTLAANNVEENAIFDLLLDGIDTVMETMTLCTAPCSKNRKECAFQLHGRLSGVKRQSALVTACLWSIEMYAKRPWLKVTGMLLANTGDAQRRFLPFSSGISAMQFGLKMGQLLLGGRGGELEVIGRRTGIETNTLIGHEDCITGFAVDRAAGELFSTSVDGRILVWRGGRKVREFRPMEEERETARYARTTAIYSISLLGDRKVACGFNDSTILIIDATTGLVYGNLEGHSGRVLSLVSSRNRHQIVSSSWDRTIRRWDARTFREIGEPLRGHRHDIECVAFNHDEQLFASASRDRSVRLWHAQEGEEACPPLEHENSVYSVTFDHVGNFLYSGSYDEVVVWDIRNHQTDVTKVHSFCHDMMRVASLALSEDGLELFASSEVRKRVFVWRTSSRNLGNDDQSSEFPHDVQAFGISSDGATMVTRRNRAKRIDLRSCAVVADGRDEAFATCRPRVASDRLAVTNDAQLVAFTSGWWSQDIATVYLISVSSGQVLHRFEGLALWLRSLRPKEDRNGGELYASDNVTRVEFNPDASHVFAETRVRRIRGSSWVSKAASWEISNGKRKSDPSISQTSPCRQSTSPCSLFVRKSARTPYDLETSIVAETNGTKEKLGSLDKNPEDVVYSGAKKQLWVLTSGQGLPLGI